MNSAGKIVVADDSAANLHALGRMFERQQYEVHIASNGAAALDLICREAPDVVVSDVMMPRMDGFELCRRVKSNPETAMTPVILITGRHEPKDRMVSINAGADDLITKPFSAEELI